MGKKENRRFFANHSKSSAMVVSLAVHAILAVVALSFVAVTVITKSEAKFEAKQVNRPRMAPKKLQVPVKIKKKQRKPKLRQRILVKHQVNRSIPDIKMPEISGIKGGLGAAGGAGLGNASSIGFNMPEISVFGVRSKGEKIFIALDSSPYIMRDAIGGMRAYQIIKDEVARIVEGLSPTTLFNLVVYDGGGAIMLFPRMVPATRENVTQVGKWLEPLNKVSEGMASTTYGVKTLGKGGTPLNIPANRVAESGKLQEGVVWGWVRPAVAAMDQRADAVFILCDNWGSGSSMRRAIGKKPEWPEAHRKKWEKYTALAKEKHEAENARRAAKGEAPQVMNSNWMRVTTYYPDARQYYPPEPPYYYFTGKDYAKALQLIRQEVASKVPAKSGLTKKTKDHLSLNVIYFAPKADTGNYENFEILAKKFHGKLRVLNGLEAIRVAVSEVGD